MSQCHKDNKYTHTMHCQPTQMCVCVYRIRFCQWKTKTKLKLCFCVCAFGLLLQFQVFIFTIFSTLLLLNFINKTLFQVDIRCSWLTGWSVAENISFTVHTSVGASAIHVMVMGSVSVTPRSVPATKYRSQQGCYQKALSCVL